MDSPWYLLSPWRPRWTGKYLVGPYEKAIPGYHQHRQDWKQDPRQEQEAPPEPAVSIRASVKPDYIVCLEDGKKLKMLKRHLMTHYNMTPEDYRQRWNLPADYPMVAPNYAEKRRELAKKIGLGRKPGARRKKA